MAYSRSRGEILPGFDCETGKAIGFTAAEWRYRTQGMKLSTDLSTMSIRVYADNKLRYEIYAQESELR